MNDSPAASQTGSGPRGAVDHEDHAREVRDGQRFTFGKNWASFLATLDEGRILEAVESLKRMLQTNSLQGKTFLDAGSGSGLFSMAARRLGAKVTSFDYDPQSVACTQELRERFLPDDPHWTVLQGSVLNPEFLGTLGQFDVVYSWGVLHHTGQMYQALDNVTALVKPKGRLFIAIYNDEGLKSRIWLRIKQIYCGSLAGRLLVIATMIPLFAAALTLKSIITRTNLFASYRQRRGMSVYHDWIDWLGGLPFEVARPEELFEFCQSRGFQLTRLVTTNRLGCNQLVCQRESA